MFTRLTFKRKTQSLSVSLNEARTSVLLRLAPETRLDPGGTVVVTFQLSTPTSHPSPSYLLRRTERPVVPYKQSMIEVPKLVQGTRRSTLETS